MKGNASRTTRIEDVLVGVFGAFIGAEFLTAMLRSAGDPQQGFGVKFGFAVFGALALLGLLALMRRSVGPMQASKKKPDRNY